MKGEGVVMKDGAGFSNGSRSTQDALRIAHHASRAAAFTLVELLVTMAIIGLLMGLLVPSIGKVREHACKARALKDLDSLATASRAFHNEYHMWPTASSFSRLVQVFAGGFDPAMGKPVNLRYEENARRIVFMEFRRKDVSGPKQDSNTPNRGFSDPWGVCYAYCFDNGYGGWWQPNNSSSQRWPDPAGGDNLLQEPFRISSQARAGPALAVTDAGAMVVTPGQSGGTIQAGFAFFSNGPDGVSGSGDRNQDRRADHEDDLRSWR
jgi:prepilin-type N-terminal cleavage/methylation domain-containing protein